MVTLQVGVPSFRQGLDDYVVPLGDCFPRSRHVIEFRVRSPAYPLKSTVTHFKRESDVGGGN